MKSGNKTKKDQKKPRSHWHVRENGRSYFWVMEALEFRSSSVSVIRLPLQKQQRYYDQQDEDERYHQNIRGNKPEQTPSYRQEWRWLGSGRWFFWLCRWQGSGRVWFLPLPGELSLKGFNLCEDKTITRLNYHLHHNSVDDKSVTVSASHLRGR